MDFSKLFLLFYLTFNIFCDDKRDFIKILDYGYYLDKIEEYNKYLNNYGYVEEKLYNDLITLKLNFTKKTKKVKDSEGKEIDEDLDDSEWSYNCKRDFDYNGEKYTLDFKLDKINGPQYKILKNDTPVDEKEFLLNNPEKKWILLKIEHKDNTFDYIFCNNLVHYQIVKIYTKKELIKQIKEENNVTEVTDEMIDKISKDEKISGSWTFFLIPGGINEEYLNPEYLEEIKKKDKKLYEMIIESVKGIKNVDKNKLIKKIKVVLCDLENIDNIENLFTNSNVEEIDVNNLKINNVKNSSELFYNCEKLKNIIGFNKLNFKNVERISNMFRKCRKLEEIDLSNFNISKCKNCVQLFTECESLKKLDLTNLNTSNVENMCGLFENCKNLEEIKGLENLNVDKVIDVEFMFSHCKKLKKIKLPKFTNRDMKSIAAMFYDCENLEEIEGLKYFDGCENLRRIDYVFGKCNKLKEFYFPNIKTKNNNDFDGVFKDLDFKNGDLDISNWDFPNAHSYDEMFMDVKNLKTLKISKLIFKKMCISCHGNTYHIVDMFKNAEIEELIITKKWDIPNDLDINTIFKDSKIKKITILEDEKEDKKIELDYDKKDNLNKFITNPEDYKNNRGKYQKEYEEYLQNLNNKNPEELKEIAKCCICCGNCCCRLNNNNKKLDTKNKKIKNNDMKKGTNEIN